MLYPREFVIRLLTHRRILSSVRLCREKRENSVHQCLYRTTLSWSVKGEFYFGVKETRESRVKTTSISPNPLKGDIQRILSNMNILQSRSSRGFLVFQVKVKNVYSFVSDSLHFSTNQHRLLIFSSRTYSQIVSRTSNVEGEDGISEKSSHRRKEILSGRHKCDGKETKLQCLDFENAIDTIPKEGVRHVT